MSRRRKAEQLKLLSFSKNNDPHTPNVFELDEIFDDIAEYDKVGIWFLRRDLRKYLRKYEAWYESTCHHPWM